MIFPRYVPDSFPVTAPIISQLVQSTIFALLAAMLALATRRNAARVRHALWLAASFKFLIPFSIFTAIGGYFDFLRPAQVPSAVERVPRMMMNIGVAAAPHIKTVHAVAPAATFNWMAVVWIVWACGCAFVIARWTREWLRIRGLVLRARPIYIGAGIRARRISAPVEPGVFGIWRPVLLLPQSMLERLSEAEFASVIEHELEHVRRRDNLTALVHMLVQAAFWFYPLVWWIGKKMVEERERACDEAVLGSGKEPESYAEGILKVCEFCIEPGAACAAGVTGADLKQRIRGIMANRMTEKLGAAKKAVLTMCAMAAVAAPIFVGMLHAQEPAKSGPAFEVASVKPNHSEDFRNGYLPQVLPGGKVSAKNAPLFTIIAWAYDVPFQGAGARLKGMEQLNSLGAFDIEAAAEKSAIANDRTLLERTTKLRAMMRTLLADRFHLVIRAETKDLPVYAAVIGKGGAKLEKSKLTEKDCDESSDQRGACHNFNGGMGRGLHAQAASMDDVVTYVANWSDRPIVNRTGMTGLFKIETPGWAPVGLPRGDGSKTGEDGVPWSERPTLFTIFEGMGLKLEATHAPITIYTIEHAEMPAAN